MNYSKLSYILRYIEKYFKHFFIIGAIPTNTP